MPNRDADSRPKLPVREASDAPNGSDDSDHGGNDDEKHQTMLTENREAHAQGHRDDRIELLAAQIASEFACRDQGPQRGWKVGGHIAGLRDQSRVKSRKDRDDHPRCRSEESSCEEIAVKDERQTGRSASSSEP